MTRYTLALGALVVAIFAGVATATPPSKIAGTFLARGTVTDRVMVSQPRTVERTKTITVRRRGKLVKRRVKVRRVIAQPLAVCAPERQCDVVVQSIVFQPGGTTGWHSHPGVLAIAVRSGAVTRYEAHHSGCPSQTYSAGQGFAERGPQHVILVRNETAQPAEILVTYIVPAGTANAALRVDQAAPAGCNVPG